ncbi:MAG: hypothetical protein N2Z85_01230 [Patescibacteria group bacterium]|nr:hypothetical protein [Patescibacteria group bacterium]
MNDLANLIFIIFALFWSIYAFFILYHFIRFGIGRQPKILAFCFLFGGFLFLIIMTVAFLNINWDNINLADLIKFKQ